MRKNIILGCVIAVILLLIIGTPIRYLLSCFAIVGVSMVSAEIAERNNMLGGGSPFASVIRPRTGSRPTRFSQTMMMWNDALAKLESDDDRQAVADARHKTEEYMRKIYKKITGADIYEVHFEDDPKLIPWLVHKVTYDVAGYGTNISFNLGMSVDGYDAKARIALEYHGPLHYRCASKDPSESELVELITMACNDDAKIRSAKENKTPLIVIPYTVEVNRLEDYIRSRLWDLQKNGDYSVEGRPAIPEPSKIDYMDEVKVERMKLPQNVINSRTGRSFTYGDCVRVMGKGEYFRLMRNR